MIQTTGLVVGLVGAVAEYSNRTRLKVKRILCNSGLRVVGLPIQHICILVYNPIITEHWHLGFKLLSRATDSIFVKSVLGFLILDLAAYWLHRLDHKVPWFWRIHQLHHSDRELDFTTHLRKNPLSAIYSVPYFYLVQFFFDVPLYGGIAYLVLIESIGFIAHARNERSVKFNRVLQTVGLISPSYHRIHHSTNAADWNSNFGMILNIWDRLFGTYRRQPINGEIRFGI